MERKRVRLWCLIVVLGTSAMAIAGESFLLPMLFAGAGRPGNTPPASFWSDPTVIVPLVRTLSLLQYLSIAVYFGILHRDLNEADRWVEYVQKYLNRDLISGGDAIRDAPVDSGG